MFGYVIPSKERLGEEEWQTYRSTYCGLCHTLQRRYGFFARFLLNYDFTFLTLLLRRQTAPPCVRCRRCLASPIRGRRACEADGAMDAASDISVLLVYWKLKDQIADERGLRRLPARALLCLLFPVFRRGRRRNPALNREISSRLEQLRCLERENCPSLDRTADQFASILTAMTPPEWDAEERRPLEQLLYHLGRWIYLIDAWDDLDEDLKRGRYNPVASRFRLADAPDPVQARAEAREHMERTVAHSENLAISAFHLGEFGYSAPVVENVLCAGLPAVRHMVFSGTWKKNRRQKRQELNHL